MIWPRKSEPSRLNTGRVRLFAIFLLMLSAACSSTRESVPTLANLPAPGELEGHGAGARNSRASAIENYRNYLEQYPDSAHRESVLRRLADLEVLQGSSILASVGEQQTESAAVPGDARAYFEAAVDHYQTLIREYPEQQNNDEVLYQLARALEGSGRPEESTVTLTRVAADGNPELYSDARFRRGEALFSRGAYAAAEVPYRSVVTRGGESPMYSQALYKLGWTLYKQGRYQEALATLSRLLDQMLPSQENADLPLARLSEADREQLDDALQAMSLSFSNLGGANAVSEYFDRIGSQSYETLVYQELGELYLSEERYHDAAQSYLTLANRKALSSEAPAYHSEAIRIYEEAGFQTRALETKRDYALSYGPGSTFWQHHEPANRASVRAKLEPFLVDLLAHYDAKARSSNDTAAYTEALIWYRLYLTAFDSEAQAPEMRFRLAQLLFAFGEFEQATREYEQSAYGYGAHRHAADAGYGSMLAREANLEILSEPERGELRVRFVASAIRFAEQFPAQPQAPAVLVRAAQERLAGGEPEPAVQLADRVLQMQPPASEGVRRSAWVTYAQSQTQLDNNVEAERGYRAALALQSVETEDDEALRASLVAAIYRQGEGSLVAERPKEAAAHFARVAANAPDPSVRAEAQYRAADAWLAVEDWSAAVKVLEELRRQDPQHPLYPDATRKLAIAYEKLENPAAAARAFEELAERSASEQRRRAALMEAARLYRQAGRLDAAVAVLERYLERYGAADEASIEVRWQLAGLSQDQGNQANRQRWLKSVVEDERKVGPARTARMRLLAADATLGLAGMESERFHSVRLVEPLKAKLSEKMRLLDGALDSYETVASYGIAEKTSAATFHIAELYRDLAGSLRTSQRPTALPARELAEYEVLLNQQAEGFTRNAVQIHAGNLGRIALGLYDPWIARSIEQLAVLEPARYARGEISEPFVPTLR